MAAREVPSGESWHARIIYTTRTLAYESWALRPIRPGDVSVVDSATHGRLRRDARGRHGSFPRKLLLNVGNETIPTTDGVPETPKAPVGYAKIQLDGENDEYLTILGVLLGAPDA